MANKQSEKQKREAGNANHETWLGVCGRGGGDGVCLYLCSCTATTLTTSADPYGPQDLFTAGQKPACARARPLYSVLVHGCVYVQSESGDIYDQGLS